MLARSVTRRNVCLTRVGRSALLRTAAASSQGRQFPPLPLGKRAIKLEEPVDPELVEPVLKWLADDAAAQPFIPVEAKYESKVPAWLPIKPFCGSFKNDQLVYLDPTVFHHPIRRDVLHACVTWYRDSLRTGTASTKTRGEVNYSNKKIRPQKGSGRARLGDRGSPMLRGGGRAFGPKPRDFSTELPKKIREMGIRVALSVKLRERKLVVVPSVDWTNWKTKFVAGRLKGMLPDTMKGCLIVTGQNAVPEKLEQTTRNLKWVVCKSVNDLQVWDVLKASHMIISLDAVEWFQENLGKPTRRPELALGEEQAAPSDSSSASTVVS